MLFYSCYEIILIIFVNNKAIAATTLQLTINNMHMDLQQSFNSDKHLVSRNKNGNIDTVIVGEKVTLPTAVGDLIPSYTLDDSGRKKEAPVKFYKNGALKSLPLEEPTEISTSIGTMPAELLIFYKSGALSRIFPLNGQVSGFWTEENEYELAQPISFKTSVGTFTVKPIYIQFYESGELESILFWPNERVLINSPLGEITIRKGLCFHTNGKLKGCEPVEEILVETPLGQLKAFDKDPNGMYAESHTLNFHPDGSIESIICSSNEIKVELNGEDKIFAPQLIPSYCNENDFFIAPMKISFQKEEVTFTIPQGLPETLPQALPYEINDFTPHQPVSSFGCAG